MRLRNMEIMVRELHMDTRQLSRRNSDSDNIPSRANSTASSQDRYGDVLHAVSQHLALTMQKRKEAENKEEWTELLGQLEKFRGRLLNHIERKTSFNAQQGHGYNISSNQLNQDLASQSPVGTPFIKPPLSRAETFDSGFGEGLPSVLEEGDGEPDLFAESPSRTTPMTPTSLFNSSPQRLDEFRNGEIPPNERRRRLSLFTGDHRTYSVSSIESNSPQTFAPATPPSLSPFSSTSPSGVGSQLCSQIPLAFPFSTSPPTFKSNFFPTSPPFELPPASIREPSSPRSSASPWESSRIQRTFSVDSSDTSASALRSSWQQVPLCGWVKMFVVPSLPTFNFANC